MDSTMIERWVKAALYGTVLRKKRSGVPDAAVTRGTAASRRESMIRPDGAPMRPDSVAPREEGASPNAEHSRLPESYEPEEDTPDFYRAMIRTHHEVRTARWHKDK